MPKIRVLVAEDSVTTRELLTAILTSDPDFELVGMAANGFEAIDLTARLRPSVIAMDIHMPGLDGFQATKRIMIDSPTPIVIISESRIANEVEISLNALRAGALTVAPKPKGPGAPDFEAGARRFLDTLKSMAHVKVVRHWPERPELKPTPRADWSGRRQAGAVVCIAASTGGPAALSRVLGDLPPRFDAPVLVVQHMADGFIEGLVQWLNRSSALPVKIAHEGEALSRSTVYFAPDDRHLGLASRTRLAVSRAAPIAGFRPSANFLFESASRAYGDAVIAVILTGMGDDGCQGARVVHGCGGRVIAQDEATSVVFGMPKAAVAGGSVDYVVALPDIGWTLAQFVGQGDAS